MPVPLPDAAPQTVWQWLFWVYAVGAGGWLMWYLIAYVRLRAALHRGKPAAADVTAAVERTAARYGLAALPGSGGGRDLFRIYLRSGASGFGGACRTDDG